MRTRFHHSIVLVLFTALSLVVALTGCGGGGGGGGGGGVPVTVTGSVYRAETDQPIASATINIGGQAATSAADGTFTFTASSSATSATISATNEATRTITIVLKGSGTNNLGVIFLADTATPPAPYNATVTGRVVTAVNGVNTPVGGATVTIANVSTVTATNGAFTLSGLPVGLGSANGTYGKVTATGFDDKPITADNLGFALKAGSNPIGDLLIARSSSAIPAPPYTITGLVQVNGKATQNVKVDLALNGASLGSVTTDSNGNYFFWVAPATYTITATVSGLPSKSVTVTLVKLDTPVTAPPINLTQ